MLFLLITAATLLLAAVIILTLYCLWLRRENEHLREDIKEIEDARMAENKAFLSEINELKDDLKTADQALERYESSETERSKELDSAYKMLELTLEESDKERGFRPGAIWAELAGVELSFGMPTRRLASI